MKLLALIAVTSLFLGKSGKALSQSGTSQRERFISVSKSVIGSSAVLEDKTLKICCEKITKDVKRVYYLKNQNGKMKLQIKGIYTRGKTIFFSLSLNNRSHLDYDVDGIRFYVTEKEKGKKQSLRLSELTPVYVYDSTLQVKGRSRATSVIVLPRFTLPAGKRLLVEVLEKNGGRHLQVEATNFTLEKARLI